MSLRNAIVVVLCASTLASLLAFCQEDPLSGPGKSIEASVPFVENTNALGGYRFVFKHSLLGLRYGLTHNTQAVSLDGGSVGLGSNSNHAFAAYVCRLPAKRWPPFALLSASALIYDSMTATRPSVQTRFVYLYVGAADFDIEHRILPRRRHRGVFLQLRDLPWQRPERPVLACLRSGTLDRAWLQLLAMRAGSRSPLPAQ